MPYGVEITPEADAAAQAKIDAAQADAAPEVVQLGEVVDPQLVDRAQQHAARLIVLETGLEIDHVRVGEVVRQRAVVVAVVAARLVERHEHEVGASFAELVEAAMLTREGK